MKPTRILLLCLLLLSASVSPSQQADGTRKLSLNEYGAQLAQLSRDVDTLASRPQRAADLRQSLPKSWTLAAPGGKEIEVSTSSLDQALQDFLKAPPERKAQLRMQFLARLRAMQQGIGEFEKEDIAGAAMRGRLEAILATREFGYVRGPSALEILWERVGAWLTRWLEKINPHLPDANGLGRGFIWLVIAAAVSCYAIYLYRLSRRQLGETSREIVPFVPSAPHWRAWLDAARAQAAAEDWRDAIHLSYWAGISYLEAIGALRPDRARTPREYLGAIGSNAQKPALVSLTRRFETVWYGGRNAAAADFAGAVSDLEALGCR